MNDIENIKNIENNIMYYDINIQIISNFNKYFSINPLDLPKILHTDIMVKNLNLKQGTIILVDNSNYYYII